MLLQTQPMMLGKKENNQINANTGINFPRLVMDSWINVEYHHLSKDLAGP